MDTNLEKRFEEALLTRSPRERNGLRDTLKKIGALQEKFVRSIEAGSSEEDAILEVLGLKNGLLIR